MEYSQQSTTPPIFPYHRNLPNPTLPTVLSPPYYLAPLRTVGSRDEHSTRAAPYPAVSFPYQTRASIPSFPSSFISSLLSTLLKYHLLTLFAIRSTIALFRAAFTVTYFLPDESA